MDLLIQLLDWVYSLKHSEITQKKIKQFYYDTTMVNICKGCDVHTFLLEIIKPVAFILQKGGQQWKIKWYLN